MTVTSVEGSAAGMQQLAAGNLQIVSLGPEEIVIGREKGIKIKGFYVQARETIYRIVVPSDNMQQIEDLHMVLLHVVFSVVRDRNVVTG